VCVSRARARRTSTLRVNQPSSERFTGSSRNSLCAQGRFSVSGLLVWKVLKVGREAGW